MELLWASSLKAKAHVVFKRHRSFCHLFFVRNFASRQVFGYFPSTKAVVSFFSKLCYCLGRAPLLRKTLLLYLNSYFLHFIREFKIWRRQRQRQQINDFKSMISLVEWRKIIVQNDDVEFSYFEVLTSKWARSSKSFTLCLYNKTIRAKQAKVQLAYFVQRDQHHEHGITAKYLT